MNGETQRNDIALIRLDEPVPIFSEEPSKSFAQPVCLPWSDYVDVNHPAIKTTGTIHCSLRISRISHSGTTDLLLLIKSFYLKVAILY